jgi:hypothetical protein
VIGETARVDLGPFDIELSVDGDGIFALDKRVLNNTPFAWKQFVLQLSTGVGAGFVSCVPGDGLGFDDSLNNHDESGAFPNVVVEEDLIEFSGFLPPGGTARFVVFVATDTTGDHLVTVRQSAVNAAPARAPMLDASSLVVLVVVLSVLAGLQLHRTRGGVRP